MKKIKYLHLFIALLLPQVAGLIGFVFTAPHISTWYAGLAKPRFNPPNWIFAPVWTILFLLMGLAAFLIWQKGLQKKQVKIALSFFVLQLVLNSLWSFLFFGRQNIEAALIEIIFLWITILITVIFFGKVSRLAGWLLLPYILWVSFAAFLNYNLWQMNLFKVSEKNFVSLVQLEDPLPNAEITSPLKIIGKARGNWFFEGNFPVVLVDWDGRIIAQTTAQAKGEWMTEEFVPFTANLIFTKPDTSVSNHGVLILRKDNPSGLPQNDDTLEVPIFFK